MKVFLGITCLFIFSSCMAQQHKLFFTTGYNYGSVSNFTNTPDLKLYNKASFAFSVGGRFYFKNKHYFIDAGMGLASISPFFFVGKANFSATNTTATDVNSFLPPIYEFLRLNISLLRSITIYTKENIKVEAIVGGGLHFLPLTYSTFEWDTQDANGTEYLSHTILFDTKDNANNEANRSIAVNGYIGICATPKLFKKNWVSFELFWNPSFNPNIQSTFVLTLPNTQYRGNQGFIFSNYGLKVLVQLPKIKWKS